MTKMAGLSLFRTCRGTVCRGVLRALLQITVRAHREGPERDLSVVFFHPPTTGNALLLHALLPPACQLAQGLPVRHGPIRKWLLRLAGLRTQKPGVAVTASGRLLFCPEPRTAGDDDHHTYDDIDGWLRQRQPFIAVMEKDPAALWPLRRAHYTVRLFPVSLADNPFSPARYLAENIVLRQQGRPKSLLRAIIDNARRNGTGRTVLCDPENTLNYRALLMRSFILSRLIGRHTNKAKAPVAILLPTSAALTLSFLAVHWRGGTPVMLNFTQGLAQCLAGCDLAGADTLISSRRFLQQAGLDAWLPALRKRGLLLLLEDLVNERSWTDVLASLHTLAPGWFRAGGTDVSVNEAAVILFTSGSEGSPKGVVLSHANLIANYAQITGRIRFQPRDVLFNCLPAFHSFGLGAGIVLPLLAGCRVHLYPSPVRYKSVIEQIRHCRATVFFSADTFLRQYVRHAGRSDVASLRLIFAGAEPLSQTTADTWREKLGKTILQGYGLTEMSPVVSFNYPGIDTGNSVGLPLAGIEYRLQPVPGVKRGGKLLLRGPNVMRGYLLADQPETVLPPPEGWHDTGDIAERDEHGFLFILGRLKRFVKTGGEMVSLDLVEKLTTQLWPDHIHAAVGVSDEQYGERVVLVTSHPEAELTELRHHIQSRGYGAIHNPTRLIHRDELPALPTGKLDYPAIQKIVAGTEK